MQAAHWISKQGLRIKQSQARIHIERMDPRLSVREGVLRLIEMPLDGLVADPRNGVPLCDQHHASFDRRNGRALDLPVPTEVREFAAEYGLEDWI